MAEVGGQARRSGGGRKVVALIVVVVLLGAAVGGWFWNRASAAAVAEEYVRVDVVAVLDGKLDVDRLKRLLRKRDAADIDWTEEETEQIKAWLAVVGKQLRDDAREGGVPLDWRVDVDEVSANLSTAKVYVTVTTWFGERGVSDTRKVHLVREGLQWKVDHKRSLGIELPAEGAPPSPATQPGG